MRFTAGIDGGGTKTTVECRNAQGAVLCRKTFGAFNLNSIGEDAFRGLLAEITGFFSGLGGCGALCIGAAGVSNPRVRELTAEAVGQAGIRRWRLAGDHETALYGALAGGPGCALIAGTGSICCGRNAAGGFARAGGWGHLIDDGGSGYALGRDALAAVARQWDGRGEETLLAELIPAQLGTGSPQELTAYAYGGGKSRIAALAPLVQQAAEAGDPAARRIVAENAGELCGLVRAVMKRLGFERCETALLGGLLAHDTLLRRTLVGRLAEELPQARPTAPKMDAAAGAALMAYMMGKE